MLSPHQLVNIKRILINAGIRYREVYQELTDHYINAVEERMQQGSSFEEALHDTHTEFGREKGLKELQKSFASNAIRHYRKLHRQEFKKRFHWPECLYIASAAMLTYLLTDHLDPKLIVTGLIILTLLVSLGAGLADRTVAEFFFSRTKSLRGLALRQQAIVMIGFIHLLFFGADVFVDWMVVAVDQFHHAFIAGLLVFLYLWSRSFYEIVRKTKPRLQ